VNHPEPPHQTDLETAISGRKKPKEDAADGAEGDGKKKADNKNEKDEKNDGKKDKSEGAKKEKSKGKNSKDKGNTGNKPEEGQKETDNSKNTSEKSEALADTHLLTADFLKSACGSVLAPNGTLTICTDSYQYGKWLLDTVASPDMQGVFLEAMHRHPSAKEGKVVKSGKFLLRSEPPPPDVCGADYGSEAGGSYFHRLKQREKSSRHQEDDRWFLCLRKKP